MTRPSHGWPTVLRCACGRLEQEHDLRPATTRLPERRVGTDNGSCAGFELAAVEERPPAGVLRARLEAVQHTAAQLLVCSRSSHPKDCHCHLPAFVAAGLADLMRAARGET